MAFLLDTSVAIHLRDNNERALVRLAELKSKPFMSAITLVELEGGVHADGSLVELRRQSLNELLSDLRTIEFTPAMAASYGRIVAATGFSRRKIIDRMIAATALVHSMTLITANGADFADIANLNLEIWTLD